MSRYADFINSDCGYTFAEYLGIQMPQRDFESRRGKGLVRFRRGLVIGEWCETQKAAKASYKAALRVRRKGGTA